MSTEALVGPVVRAGDVADAVVEAVRLDNPGRNVTVEDHTAYLRVQCPNECIIRRTTIEETLGRPFEMRELEVNLASFAGQIETATDQFRFFSVESVLLPGGQPPSHPPVHEATHE